MNDLIKQPAKNTVYSDYSTVLYTLFVNKNIFNLEIQGRVQWLILYNI